MCQRDHMIAIQRGGCGRSYRGAGLLANAYQAGLRYKNVNNNEKQFPGETHTILKVNGANMVANYMGPGTNVKKRLLRGDEPVSDMDSISLAHDLRYTLAKGPEQIRDADRRFLKRARTSSDVSFNTRQSAAIAAKYAIESKTGVKYPSQNDMDLSDGTDSTLVAKLQEMEQKGFGSDPAHALKEKLMGHRAKVLGKHKKKGRGLNLAGRGLRLAGRGPKIQRVKKYLKAGWEMAKPHVQRYVMETTKDALQKKFSGGQSGGFIWIPFLIAAAVAAAKATALGAAGAVGAWGVNKALKGKGIDENVRNAIERVQLTIKDFSPSAAKKITMAQTMLNANPQSINAVSKILQPIIKASLAQKLQAWGITKTQAGGCMSGGSSSEFTKVLANNLGM